LPLVPIDFGETLEALEQLRPRHAPFVSGPGRPEEQQIRAMRQMVGAVHEFRGASRERLELYVGAG
jgi:hypothetical protein